MKLAFYKYEGTGNDFILVDNRSSVFDKKNTVLVKRLCNRRFGIGADGLLLLNPSAELDFDMTYYNADGNLSSMCGNGGRCITALAKRLDLVQSEARFTAADGAHEAKVLAYDDGSAIISLKMKDVSNAEVQPGFIFLDTGSPHYVTFRTDIDSIDIITEGRKIRNNARFQKEGVNVNFAEIKNGELYVRTYERGVEDETLSCGTGVTASVLAARIKDVTTDEKACNVNTRGGMLTVRFTRKENNFTGVWLEGPVKLVFEGEIAL